MSSMRQKERSESFSTMSSPFSGRTPESTFSGLRRKDSRHALTTCHGITSNGRACRRGLTAKDVKYTVKGSILIPGEGQDAAVFFCWQHKEQAEELVKRGEVVVDVDERTSLETVFRSLGLNEVVEEEQEEEEEEVREVEDIRPRDRESQRVRKSGSRTEFVMEDGQRTPRRSISKPDFIVDEKNSPRRRDFETEQPETPTRPRESRRRSSHRRSSPKQSPGIFSIFTACLSSPDIAKESPPRTRHRRHTSQPTIARTPKDRSPRKSGFENITPLPTPNSDRFAGPTSGNDPTIFRDHERKDSGVSIPSPRRRKSHDNARKSSQYLDPHHPRLRKKSDTLRVYRDEPAIASESVPYSNSRFMHSEVRQPLIDRKPLAVRSKSSPESNTTPLQFWTPSLPPNADDTVRICYAKLLTAMSEKPTKSDDQGYLYMFWQTELPTTEAETDAAASIVSHSLNRRLNSSDEEILQRRFFQTSANAALPAIEKRKLFLKIGRAANVHQRMTQWQKQCGYNISLLRYYPQPEEDSVMKIRFVGKVERLVHLHLEMLGSRVKKECRCGTEHREWFEIEATPKAVREIDGIITQWVAWCLDKYSDT